MLCSSSVHEFCYYSLGKIMHCFGIFGLGSLIILFLLILGVTWNFTWIPNGVVRVFRRGHEAQTAKTSLKASKTAPIGIPYSLNVHFMQTQPALGNPTHVQWILEINHGPHISKTTSGRFEQMHTKAPDADNLKSQVANTQRSQSSEAICNYYSAACDPHLAANLVALSYSQGFRRNKSRKRSSRLQSWHSFTTSQIESIQKCCGSLVGENSTWSEVNLCPLTAQEDDREVPLRREQCPHNWLHFTGIFAGAQSALENGFGKLSDLHA